MRENLRQRLEHRTLAVLSLAAVGLLITGGIAASNVFGDSNSDVLVAEYRFDTGAGGTAYDTAGEGDGELENFDFDSDDGWVKGIKGGALKFSGEGTHPETSDTIVTVSDGQSENFDNEITVSWWGKITEAGEFVNSGGITNGFAFYTSNPRFIITDESGNYKFARGTGIEDGKWHHFVGVYDNTPESDNIKLYIDGRLVDEADGPGNMQSWSRISIGGDNGGDYRTVDGTIDDVKLFNYPLNASNVKSLYNSGSWRFGTSSESFDTSKVLDMSFQDQNSTHVYDSSGIQNHGRPQNGASQEYANSCKVGRCYSFDGNDDHVDISDAGNFPEDNESFTFSAWVNIPRTCSSKSGIFGYGNWGSTNQANALRTSNDCTDIYHYFWGNDHSTTGLSVNDGSWHHVSVWYNGSRRRIYVDGALEASDNPGDVNVTAEDANIGVTNNNEYFEGRIDQVKLYDRALTPSEILEQSSLDSDGAVFDMGFRSEGGGKVEDQTGDNILGDLRPNESYGPKRIKNSAGNALEFDGDDDHVRISGDSGLHMSDGTWTQVIWAKGEYDGSRRTALRLSGGWQTLIEIVNEDKWEAGFYNGNGWNWVSAETDTSKLHQIVFVGREDGVELWIDGEKRDSLSTTATPPASRDGNSGFIGSTGGSRYYNGQINNVKLYQEAMRGSQIKNLYSAGKSSVGSSNEGKNQEDILLDYDFNSIEKCGSADTVDCPSGMDGKVSVDGSGESHHGELVNGAEERNSHECKIGGCIGLDGADDYVKTNDISSYTNGSTLSWWMNIPVQDSDYNRIVSSSGDLNILFTGDGTSGLYGVLGNSSSDWILNAPDLTGGWKHVALRIENDKVIGYVDGEKVSTTNRDIGDVELKEIYVGSDSGSNYFLEGRLDEFRIYNRSLSEREIWDTYTDQRDRVNSEKGALASYRFDSGPKTCILNQDGGLSDGGWGGPSDSVLKNALDSEGWETEYVQVGDITEDGWRSCDVIVFPNGERYPAFDKSRNFCSDVDGEGGEHDVYLEMKEFMNHGGMLVGTWGAGLWYGQAWNGSSWESYTSCSQYDGGELYHDGGQERCSDIGYSCYSGSSYHYSNALEGVTPSLPGNIDSAPRSNRWASSFDTNILQAYNSTSGNQISGDYIGIEHVGSGYYFHPGSNTVFNPSSYDNSSSAWNNLLTWYAGDGKQRFWDLKGGYDASMPNGGDPVYIESERGTAISLDGEDNVVEVPHDQSFQVSNTGEFTITGRINLRDTSKDTWERLLEKGSYGSGGYSIQRGNPSDDPTDDKRVRFYFANSDGWEGGMDIVSPSQNTLNESHTFTVTVDSGEVATYFDKKKTNQKSGWSYTPVSQPLHIGGSNSNGGASLSGSIDSLRFYPYALTENEITELRSGGAVGVNS